ncbi:MAG TPA: aminoacyl-tRNA hydrolase [Spirochaetales bacterium]|nr:aminoacyl-tRNA hydrolase [Spirochaetales bacterium]
MVKLVCFLGNPGREYQDTRHNIGWMMAEEFSQKFDPEWKEKFSGSYAVLKGSDLGCQIRPGSSLILLKPGTFMNRSGESLSQACSFFKISPKMTLVVHDDLELPFGTVSFRLGGGTAGHNGLRSLVSSLGTEKFFRFRIGISRPAHGNVSSYVLRKFAPQEEKVLPAYLSRAAEHLWECIERPEAYLERYSKIRIL